MAFSSRPSVTRWREHNQNIVTRSDTMSRTSKRKEQQSINGYSHSHSSIFGIQLWYGRLVVVYRPSLLRDMAAYPRAIMRSLQPAHGSSNNGHNRATIALQITKTAPTPLSGSEQLKMTASDQPALLETTPGRSLALDSPSARPSPSVCCPVNQTAPATGRRKPNKDQANRRSARIYQQQ